MPAGVKAQGIPAQQQQLAVAVGPLFNCVCIDCASITSF